MYFRLDCYSGCNDAYFPELDCKHLSYMHFIYNGNKYDKLYLFSRPNITLGQTHLDVYEQCKSYVSDNLLYPYITNTRRQARLHTCFSYCRNGDDDAMIGDDRANCIDLKPEERDKIICLYPEEQCE